jgi:FMN phosphatase YigB (HAD superfamily)
MDKLKEIFDKNRIKGVVFDLDGTLIDTYSLMLVQHRNNSKKMVQYLKDRHNIHINLEEFIRVYQESENESYNLGNVDFTLRFPDMAKMLCQKLGLDIDPQELVDNFIGDIGAIYTMAPEPFDGALELLHRLSFTKLLICTHSGKDWSILKFDNLKKRYKDKYGIDLNILLHYISLDKPKNSEEWLKASELIKEDPNDLIVVGDSFHSDIISSAEAKYKYLVWISKNIIDRKQDIEELETLGHKTSIVEHISKVENLLTSNQLFQDI